jgi:hypothetical protein
VPHQLERICRSFSRAENGSEHQTVAVRKKIPIIGTSLFARLSRSY